MEIEIILRQKITEEMLGNLMVTAFEGGINYWCKKVKVIKFPISGDLDWLASDVIAHGGDLKLYDDESDDTWILNREMLLKGIKMYCEDWEIGVEEMYENHDALTADAIVQYALFNEIIFS